MLEVSDEVHGLVAGLVSMCRDGGAPSVPRGDPAQHLAGVRRRLMLDVSYAGSALIGQAGAFAGGPAPGERFPFGHRLKGTGHHLILFGSIPRLDHLRERWGGLVSIIDAAEGEFDAAECGLPGTGAILVRPDGFIGFRATPADGSMVEAIHAHLETYLVPDVVGSRLNLTNDQGPVSRR